MRAIATAILLTSLPGLAAELAETAMFPADSKWEVVGKDYNVAEGIAAGPNGEIYITDVPAGKLFKLDAQGAQTVVDSETPKANGLAFAPDGRLCSPCMAEPAIVVWDLKSGKREMITLPSPANDLAITTDGKLYCTWGKANAVYQLNLADPEPLKVADIPNPNGITLSHDGKELWVGEFQGDTVRAFPILADGKLGPSRAAFKAKVPASGKGLLDGMTPLADGRLLASTALGLQVLSPDGTAVVIENPTDQRANYVRIITDASGQRWIYAAHVKSILRRRTLL